MARKQSATKPSTKSTDAGTSNQSQKNVAPATVSKDAANFWAKDCFPERGFKTSDAEPSFMETVNNLGWQTFIKPRDSYCIPIVREFYAGILEQKHGKPLFYSTVRGKRVDFDPLAINDLFLLGYNGTEFEKRVENADKKEMDRVKSRIADKNAIWERCKPTEYNMKSSFLTPEAHTWHQFITCSLFPTSHTSSIKKERMLAIDSILNEANIDIGRIIAHNILRCKNKNAGSLFFPSLVTKLCIKAEVPIERNDERKLPPCDISASFKERTKVQKPSTDMALLEQFMHQQRAVWKWQREQGFWIEIVMNYCFKNSQLIVPQPPFPDWVLKEETEEKEEEEKQEPKPKPTKKPRVVKRKPPTRKEKDKKVMTEDEPILSSGDLEETTEEDEASKAVKEIEKDEEEDGSETESDHIEITGGEIPQPKKRKPSKPFLPGDPILKPVTPPSKTTSPVQPSTNRPQTQPPTESAIPETQPAADIKNAGTKRKLEEVQEEEPEKEEENAGAGHEEDKASDQEEVEEDQTTDKEPSKKQPEQATEGLTTTAEATMASINAAATHAATIAPAENVPSVAGATKNLEEINPVAAATEKSIVEKTLAAMTEEELQKQRQKAEGKALAKEAETKIPNTPAKHAETEKGEDIKATDAPATIAGASNPTVQKKKKQKKEATKPATRASNRLKSKAAEQ